MADTVLTTVGLKCPKPLFEVHRMMQSLASGAQLEVVADDPAFKLDIQAWCRRTGHALLELKNEASRYTALIRKS